MPLLECVPKHDTHYLMPVFVSEHNLLDNLLDFCLFAALTAKMPQYVRGPVGNLIILLFISFGYRELKVGREYMVNVFNRFINAWFGLLILTCISYDYADI